MRYATFRSGPWPPQSGLGKLLLRFLPRANPDFDSVYQRVENWWLEIDENDVVCRELAFDSVGKPLAAAPLGSNYGIFTDLNHAPENLGPEVDAAHFESMWERFEQTWLEAKRGRGAV